MIQVTCEMTHK